MLADWIVDLAEHDGYLAQTTSVPGVAQRTGATIYYVELFPKGRAGGGRAPVLALMPVPGDVDVVLASELMEAGRAVQRGFVTPDAPCSSPRPIASMRWPRRSRWATAAASRTCSRPAATRRAQLRRASTWRRWRSDRQRDQRGAVRRARRLRRAALPARGFEATIRRGGVGVKASLAAFAAGFEAARAGEATLPRAPHVVTARLLQPPASRACCAASRGNFRGGRRPSSLPASNGSIDYQDAAYARNYLTRMRAFARSSSDTATAPAGCSPRRRASSRSPCPTRTPSASPTSRSASSRFARVRAEAQVERRANSRDRRVLSSPPAGDRRYAAGAARPLAHAHALGAPLLERLTRKGKIVKTTSISGFLLLYSSRSSGRCAGARCASSRSRRRSQAGSTWSRRPREPTMRSPCRWRACAAS